MSSFEFPITAEKKPSRKGAKSSFRIDRNIDIRNLCDRFWTICSEMRQPVAYLELAHARPKEGVVSSFKSGLCFGIIKTMLMTESIPFITVAPVSWTKTMHVPGDTAGSAKERTWNSFERLYTAFANQYVNRPPEGIIDACMIAEYGRRRIEAGLDLWRLEQN